MAGVGGMASSAGKYYETGQHFVTREQMIIVGVGCGPELMTMQAANIIFNAKRVAGSSQALALAEEYIQEGCKVYVLQDYFKLEEYPRGHGHPVAPAIPPWWA